MAKTVAIHGGGAFAAPWGVPIIAVALVVSACLLVMYWRRVRKRKAEPLLSETIDMSKWAQDEGGQWFPVKYRRGDDVIMDTSEPSQRRAVKWINNKRENTESGWVTLASFVFCIAAYWAAYVQTADNDLITPAKILFWLVCAVGTYAFLLWVGTSFVLARGRGNFVGPEATAAAGRGVEQVEKQKVYGAGGFATREEIHQAAHGKTVGQATKRSAMPTISNSTIRGASWRRLSRLPVRKMA